MMKRYLRITALCLCVILTLFLVPSAPATAEEGVTLRISNWEEYLDFGDWDEDEAIELESDTILGVNHMVLDFEEWYEETYGIPVHVEYSAFGSNEDFYNQLTLGDEFDLACPSEYMVMKLMAENQLVPLSEEFFDTEIEENYYIRMVSPYIQNILEEKGINGESWSRYMAGYMWGVTGIVYNPEEVTKEEASTWKILADPKFARQVTIKDNVRDSYFAALGAMKSDLLTSEEFLSAPDYPDRLEAEMNDVSDETIAAAQDYLKAMKENAYSFESDSGKADMITGKVLVNLQWSGDGVYTLDQADEDDFLLSYTVPEEATNIYFDGWVLLKNGIKGDAAKQHAAEAFINFVSRPDNVIRNMYYVGYTSVIAGNEDDTRIFEYADWNFGAEEDEEDTVEYPLGYFFSGDEDDEDYILEVPEEALERQLYAQYPDADTLARSSIMVYFDGETNEKINQMWINVRCLSIDRIPLYAWILAAAVIAAFIIFLLRRRKNA